MAPLGFSLYHNAHLFSFAFEFPSYLHNTQQKSKAEHDEEWMLDTESEWSITVKDKKGFSEPKLFVAKLSDAWLKMFYGRAGKAGWGTRENADLTG